MVSEVHCGLVPLLWVCGEAENHGGEGIMEKRCSPVDGWEAQTRGGRTWGQDISFKGTPPMTYFLHLLIISHSAMNS
jgi:hypothetical protein